MRRSMNNAYKLGLALGMQLLWKEIFMATIQYFFFKLYSKGSWKVHTYIQTILKLVPNSFHFSGKILHKIFKLINLCWSISQGRSIWPSYIPLVSVMDHKSIIYSKLQDCYLKNSQYTVKRLLFDLDVTNSLTLSFHFLELSLQNLWY